MRVNPLVILMFNILLPVTVMFPGNPYRHPFFLLFALLVLLMMGRPRRLAKLLAAYGLLTALSRASLLLPGGMGQYFEMFFVITVQFMPCLMMASVLIGDYTPGQIISALEPLHIPKAFTVALTIVIRYIPTFKKEFAYIRESMRLRNVPYSLRRPVRSFEFFLVPQLFRCAMLADELTSAGLTKGITCPARRTSFCDMRMRRLDYLLCAVLTAGTGVCLLWR